EDIRERAAHEDERKPAQVREGDPRAEHARARRRLGPLLEDRDRRNVEGDVRDTQDDEEGYRHRKRRGECDEKDRRACRRKTSDKQLTLTYARRNARSGRAGDDRPEGERRLGCAVQPSADSWIGRRDP